MKKKKFKVAIGYDDYNTRRARPESEPSSDNLRNWLVVPYMNSNSKSMTRVTRYIELKKNHYLVEVWDSYCPLSRGALGRQRSVIRARYQIQFKTTGRGRIRNSSWNPYGVCEKFYWSGGLEERTTWSGNTESNNNSFLKKVVLTPQGKLKVFEDRTRGENNMRIVEFEYNRGERDLVRWRGRYTDKQMANRWRRDILSYTIRKTEDGSPLFMDGNFLERDINEEGFIIDECRYVNGRRHGTQQEFNKFGRVINEKYWHHGVEVPRWMYTNPQDVTVEEILDESNAEVRRAILELQGFEVFLNRCKDRKILKVVDKDPDERVGELIRIKVGNDRDRDWRGRRNRDNEEVMLLKVKDGTLPKHYVLRVPPNMKTARQANAWTWGKTADQYAPSIER